MEHWVSRYYKGVWSCSYTFKMLHKYDTRMGNMETMDDERSNVDSEDASEESTTLNPSHL